MQTPLPPVFILAGLNAAALALLAKEACRVAVKAGTAIVREGDPGSHLYFIESGSVRVCKKQGRTDEFELDRMGPGDFFGEMCILEELPRSATVQAVSDVMLIQVSATAFYQLHKEMPDQFGVLVLNIARDLSSRLRRVDEIFAARQ